MPEVIVKAALLLNKNDRLLISIPNEETIFWRLGTLLTSFEFQRMYGLDYQVLMKYEHVNTAKDIEDVLTYFFKNIKCSVFGVSKNLAFYRFYVCSNPNFERADSYLDNNR